MQYNQVMQSYSSIIKKRLRVIGIVAILMAGIIICRMFDIQFIKYDKYTAMAQSQQRFEKIDLAQRGKILVHDSSTDPSIYFPLAFDVKSFALWVVPSQVKDKKKTADELAALTGMNSLEIYGKINNDKLYIPPIKSGLTYDQSNTISEKNLRGVFTVPEYSRFYPESTLASQVLGFVNANGEGKYGFEGHYNSELKGVNGEIKGEKDTSGEIINLLEQTNAKDGVSYVLTLDRSLQYFVEKKLAETIKNTEATSGTVVIMDIQTGGIIAMASNPSFDPNNYRQTATDNSGLFVNPAIAYLYEPGSIFKPIIMSAALDQGVVSADTTETFDWHTFVDGHEIKTAELKAFGKETMTQVLENSDNVAMVWVADKLGNDTMYKYLEKFNFLSKTGIDLDSEQSGYTVDLKQWRNINRANISFGQGILVSPIQMVSAYAAIANGGKYIYPHIVDKILFSDGTEKKIEKQEGEQVISSQVAKTMAEMLSSVVKNGHSKQAAVKGFNVGAKTGTAQIAVNGSYEVSEDGLGIYNHSLAGFAPVENPRYAMLVKLERPKSSKYAETTTAPLFGEISSYLLNNYYRLTPTN